MSPTSDQANGNGGVPSLELPLLALPTSHPCNDCGACCRYIAIEIDSPTGYKDYDHIRWYLVHQSVAVYIDWEGDWFVEFATSCEHLSDSATCDIYSERPQICSDFSWETCEKSTGEDGHKVRFETAEEFLAWFEERRPKAFKKYADRRAKLLRARVRAVSQKPAGQGADEVAAGAGAR